MLNFELATHKSRLLLVVSTRRNLPVCLLSRHARRVCQIWLLELLTYYHYYWLAAAAFGWWFYNIIYLLLFSGGNEAFFHVNFIMIMVINALWHGIKFYLIFKANYDFNEHAQQFFLTSLIIFSFSWRKNQSMLWVLNPIRFCYFIFQCELRLL